MLRSSRKLIVAAVLLFLTVFAFANTLAAQGDKKPGKITAEELITKHLASIGQADKMAQVKDRILVGQGFVSGGVGYVGRIGGPVQFASSGDMFLFALLFGSGDYPYEKLAYDGKDISTGKISGGNGSTELGKFVRGNSVIAKRGLFGGALSSAWPLYKLDKGEKLESISLVTNNGVQLYKAKFSSPSNGQLSVTLYFEAETFRHVMTEYKYDVPPPQSGPIVTEADKPTYFAMIETFGDFKKVADFVLPTRHQIDISIVEPTQTSSLKWTMVYSQVYFNQDLKPEMFKVS